MERIKVDENGEIQKEPSTKKDINVSWADKQVKKMGSIFEMETENSNKKKKDEHLDKTELVHIKKNPFDRCNRDNKRTNSKNKVKQQNNKFIFSL